MAAIAEHVSPAAKRLKVWVAMAAEMPGGADQPALMTAWVAVIGDVISVDAAVHRADRLGRLGGVLRQVGRDRKVGRLVAGGQPDDPDVELAAPPDIPALRLGGMRD